MKFGSNYQVYAKIEVRIRIENEINNFTFSWALIALL